MLHCISSYWCVSLSTDRQLLASLLCKNERPCIIWATVIYVATPVIIIIEIEV